MVIRYGLPVPVFTFEKFRIPGAPFDHRVMIGMRVSPKGVMAYSERGGNSA